MNWQIVEQIQKVRGDEFPVNVKMMKWRPASAKEKAIDENATFKPMRATYCMLFEHKNDAGNCFKITAQHRNGQWMFNLHDPVKLKYKQVRVDRTVEMPDGTKRHQVFANIYCEDNDMKSPALRAERHSTGTTPLDLFFTVKLPDRIRCPEFRKLVHDEFMNALPSKDNADDYEAIWHELESQAA